MLRVGCNIVESNIVNCGIVSWLEKHEERWKQKQNEKVVETDMNIWN